MAQARDILRLLLAYQSVWFTHFPALSRRAEYHILRHLCLGGRGGAPVGELYGLGKQTFLLDDATVKERIVTLAQHQLCEVDAGQPIYARTLILPTPALLAAFDAHLRDFALTLNAAAPALGVAPLPAVPAALSDAQRALLLRPVRQYEEKFGAALDAILTAGALSPARRHEARRNLQAPSHWNLFHTALDDAFDSAEGVLADRLSADLLRLTGQSLQTTRDHIGYLLDIGLFSRLKGRALRVGVPEAVRQPMEQLLALLARDLPSMLAEMHAGLAGHAAVLPPRGHAPAETSTVATDIQSGGPEDGADPPLVLEIVEPSAQARRLALRPPQTIGRSTTNSLVLQDTEVSRQHCLIAMEDGAVLVTDLGSTNGTFVNGERIAAPAVLRSGDRLTVGTHVLLCSGAALAVPRATGTLGGGSRRLREPLTIQGR